MGPTQSLCRPPASTTVMGNCGLLITTSSNSTPSWFGFPIFVSPDAPFTRDEATLWLDSNKVGTRLLFGGNLIHQPAYTGWNYRVVGNLEKADQVMRQVFWIGVYPGLTPPMLEYVVDKLEQLTKR